MSMGLPEGWVNATLKDIVLHKKGKKPKETVTVNKNGYLPYVLIDEMEGKQVRAYTKDKNVPVADENDVLIVWDGSIGKTATGIKGAIGSTIAALSPIIVEANFLNAFLQLSKPVIEQTSRGTGLQHINPTTFWPLQFPLPPYNEQKRIAAKLEKIMPRIDAFKQRLERIPQIIKRFRQSVLTVAVTGNLTEEWREEHPDVESADVLLERIRKEREKKYKEECGKAKKHGRRKPKKPSNLVPKVYIQNDVETHSTWIWMTFEDISQTKQYAMSSGPFGSALGTKDYINMGVPVIRGQNIQDGKFVAKNFVFISKEKADDLKRSKTIPGDIIIVAVGNSGNAAIVPDNFKEGILSQNCNKFTIDQLLVFPEYIIFSLQISILKEQMKSVTTDTVRQFLSLTNLKKMLFPIPPIEEQKEIIRQVDKLFSFADKLEAHYNKAKEKIDKLPRSVLAKTFRGELVPQDPNDEPASELLKRIIAEKEKRRAEIKKTKKQNEKSTAQKKGK